METNGRGPTDENQGGPSWKEISVVLHVRARREKGGRLEYGEKKVRAHKGRKMVDWKGVRTYGCPEKADVPTWKGVCWAYHWQLTGRSLVCLLQGRFHILVP